MCRYIIILDPGIKIESGYTSYDRGIDQDIFVKTPDGKSLVTEVSIGYYLFDEIFAFTRNNFMNLCPSSVMLLIPYQYKRNAEKNWRCVLTDLVIAIPI